MNRVEQLGRTETRWVLSRVTPCEYVNDGDGVLTVIDGKVRRVTVSCVAGAHARVRDADGAERWRHVNDLARENTREAGGSDA